MNPCPTPFAGLALAGPCPDCGHTLYAHNADQTCNECNRDRVFSRTIRQIRRRARMLGRAIATLAIAAATLAISPTTTEAQSMTTYRIVHTGDSISAMAWGIPSTNGGAQWVTGEAEWRNLEYGRDAYTPGLMGSGSASTSSIWPLIRDRSEPGGWIVIQDNGANSTEANWRTLMEKIRDETPSDRGLIIVLPGFRSDINGPLAGTTAARARIMREVFATHPSVVLIHLDQYLKRNPAYFPDGQHPWNGGAPTPAAAWLKAEITKWTG